MGRVWFVQKNDIVDGPLSADDVQSRLSSGSLSAQHLIWGKGLEAWIRLENWKSELLLLSTDNQPEVVQEAWHYAHAGKSHGPYTKGQLIDELKSLDSLNEMVIWTKGMKEWAPLFEFHDLLTAIGLNKRQFPRAELTGRAMIKTTENTLIGQVTSISEGGCGVIVDQGLVPGQPFFLEIQSPGFRETLHAKAECRYVSEGFAGIRFTQISSETKSAIIQFVKQSQTRFVLKAA